MKKRSIAFFLCLFFLCIGIVQAKEDPFALDWKNDDKATTFEQVGIIDANLIYNDDYVNFRIDMNPYNQKISTILRRYDHDGNLVKEKELVHKLVKNIVTDGEYIYAVTFDIGSMYGGYYAETFGIDPAQYGVSSYDDYEIGLSIVKFNKNFAIEEEFNFKESDLECLYDVLESVDFE